ncbi:hypothetical protein CYMTET_40613 [Cymbomonas tetramitiformis]|uniref:Uncharacterized protein n=1 Tax=Cymbomonas tetramitiformis TaxID=36881 RepID=A0AAE0C7M8_9CHLO|nr:hypothetical protein CYMTET_40613 [Cymbomonas tetramitiformis]
MTARSLTVRRLLRESDIGAGIHLSEVHEKFTGKDKAVAKLGKLIVLLKTEFSTAGLDLASFEFDNPALEVIPLYFLATDRSTDRDGRRALIDLVKGCVPAGLRVSHPDDRVRYVVGTAAAAAIPTGDDSEAKQLLKVVVDKLRVLEQFIKNQKGGTSALKAATGGRDCRTCAKADRGVLYNGYKDCPLGGGRPGAHTFCCPTAEHGEEEMRALVALCHVYQQAAGDGPEAFSQRGVDLSMYGFAVGGAQDQKEQEESESASEVVVSRVTTVLQDAGAAGSLCPNGCCFGPECAWGMPRSGADTSFQAAAVKVPGPAGPLYVSTLLHGGGGRCGRSVAEQAESESSSDDEAAEVLFVLLCFGMLGVGAALCIGGEAAAGTIEGNNNFNIQADPVIYYGQVCLYPAIDTLILETLQQALQVFSAVSEPASTSGGVDTGD